VGRHEIPTDWLDADAFLAGGRDKSRRTVANNTYLRRGYGGESIDLVLHSTAIVTYARDGLTVRMGGWDTVTTRDRINRALPGPWRIGNQRIGRTSEPWVWHGGYPVLPFVDHLTIDPDTDTIRMDGETIMSADDIHAERARIEAVREKRAASRQVMLATQHARGVAGAFGTVELYDWRDKSSRTVTAYHPRTYGGTLWDCVACQSLPKETA
jgi:hypothetical protein